jgi:hypothetical protein
MRIAVVRTSFSEADSMLDERWYEGVEAKQTKHKLERSKGHS